MTQATVTTKPDHRGELRRKPLKPLRAGMPGEPGEPTVTTSCAHYPFRTRDCGCIKHPAFPTPFLWRAEKFMHNSGAFAPRECGGVNRVIASAAKQSIFEVLGTMDCFAEPVIGRRFAPTRWLAMT